MRAHLLTILLLTVGCGKSPDDNAAKDGEVPFPINEVPLTGFVDPLVGTAGSGNTIPGALVPHGVMRAGPDTVDKGGEIGAYHYDATTLHGFTHTHLEGPGGSGNGYSQLLILPTTGPLNLDHDTRVSSFSHDTEQAKPGYYAVTLDDYDVDVELTATGHGAIHRYQYPAGEAHWILDLGHSQGVSVIGELEIDGSTLSGRAVYNMHPVAAMMTLADGRTAYSTLYFHIELSEAPTAFGTFTDDREVITHPGDLHVASVSSGAWVDFDFSASTTVEARIGISHISADYAKRNLDEEILELSVESRADRVHGRQEVDVLHRAVPVLLPARRLYRIQG